MLRIQPHLPLLWRTPASCQLGSISRTVVLPTVLPPHERLLAALRDGVPRATYDALARQQGFSVEESAEFLELLAPALEISSAPGVRSSDGVLPNALKRVFIAGDGPGQGEIRYVFDDVTSHQIALSTAADTHDADIAVLMGSYLIAGETAGSWLRRDIPHLLVTYDEQGATIGPLVLPGRTPCAHCVDLHRRDADPSWVALASQLLYREHPQPSAALKCAVAIEVVRLVAFRDDIINAGVHVRIRSDDLEKTVTPSEFHPDCQCRSLQENVTSLASRRANRTQMPTTV